jgi:hypothetical protein
MGTKPTVAGSLAQVTRLDVVTLRALVVVVVHVAPRFDRVSRIYSHSLFDPRGKQGLVGSEEPCYRASVVRALHGGCLPVSPFRKDTRQVGSRRFSD